MSHFPSLSAFIMASLTWVAVLWLTPGYLRHRQDVRWSVFWQTVLLLALALTFVVPPVYLAVDRFLHLPNAARWISNACVLLGAYMVDTFFWTLAHGPERLTWHRRWLLFSPLLTLAVMAIALWRVGYTTDVTVLDLPVPQPALVVYRVVYLAFLGFVLARMSASATHYRRQTLDPVVQVGMVLTIAGSVAGMGYIGFTLALILTPESSPLAVPLELGVTLSLLMSVICVTLSATAPQWGRHLHVSAVLHHLRVVRAYWRLGPLWRQLSKAHPHVVLPTTVSWRAAVIRPREMDFLVQRRVIEILDARRLLLTGHEPAPADGSRPMMGGKDTETARRIEQPNPSTRERGADVAEAPHMTDVAGDIPATHNTSGAWQRTRLPENVEQLAHEEAQLLSSQLASLERGGSTPPSPLELFQPATYEESIQYLERVAAALKTTTSHLGRHTVTWRQASQNSQERRYDFGQQSPA